MLFIWIRQLVAYGLAIGLLIAVVLIVPRFARLRVNPEYQDIANLEVDRSLNTDTGVKFGRLKIGDPIAFRLGGSEQTDVVLGWIAAMPGDSVSVRSGSILVNNAAATSSAGEGTKADIADRPPVVVPVGHCFVLSHRHQFDSIAYGFLPAGAIHGKLGKLQ